MKGDTARKSREESRHRAEVFANHHLRTQKHTRVDLPVGPTPGHIYQKKKQTPTSGLEIGDAAPAGRHSPHTDRVHLVRRVVLADQTVAIKRLNNAITLKTEEDLKLDGGSYILYYNEYL